MDLQLKFPEFPGFFGLRAQNLGGPGGVPPNYDALEKSGLRLRNSEKPHN